MRRCCETCIFRKDLVKWDYSQGGCVHTKYDGFACLALASEGNVIHMVGIDQHENDGCEMWIAKPQQIKTDAVQVVRCHDCAKAEEDSIFREYWCDGREVPADHFCGYGVKKGD